MEVEDVPAEQPAGFEVDAQQANNVQYCVEYVHEIFEHLICSENKLLPSSTYMDSVSPSPPSRCAMNSALSSLLSRLLPDGHLCRPLFRKLTI